MLFILGSIAYSHSYEAAEPRTRSRNKCGMKDLWGGDGEANDDIGN